MFSPLTKQLIHALTGLPGVGPKTAQRMAFHLLQQKNHNKGQRLSEALHEAIEHIGMCSRCRSFTETPVCEICESPKRQKQLICVVENPQDIAAIEQTHSYTGTYFVLHGHLSPLDGIGPNDIGIPALIELLNSQESTELIIATNPTVEGRATAHYIATHVDRRRVTCSRIAHGVPMGGELEYLDGNTLAHAIQSRLPINETT